MRKIAISLFALAMGGLTQAMAENTDISAMENVVYMNSATFEAGSQQVLSVRMKNTVGIQTAQFDMVLPEGITVAKDDEGFELISLSTERTTAKKMDSFSTQQIQSSRYRVLINSNGGYTFDGNDGEIVQVVVDIDAAAAQGELPLRLEDIVLVDNNSNGFETSLVETAITISGVDDGRIKFNENSASLPKYTAGEKGDVTMMRSIKAGHWSTIVLPFTLTKAKAEAAFGADVQVAEFTGFETTYSDEDDVTPDAITIKLTSLTMSAKKGMTGGKPYMIKTSQDITTFQADDVTLTDAVTDVQGTDEFDTAGKLTGSLVATTIPANGLYVSDNKFWYSAGQTAVKAFRCWFELGAVLDQETDFGARVYLAFENETTGISEELKVKSEEFIFSEGVSEPNSLATAPVYDLSGRKIENIKSVNRKLQRGLYIVNNKKVVVK